MKVWKLRVLEKQVEFSYGFVDKIKTNTVAKMIKVDKLLLSFTNNLMQETEQVCGVSPKHWWNKQM